MLLKKIQRKLKNIRRDNSFLRNPFLWIYAAYLTIRYVDNSKSFPAIEFINFVQVKIVKKRGSILRIEKKLIFDGFLSRSNKTIIFLLENALLHLEGEFTLGDGISILVSDNATLKIKGKKNESASGVTANSKIMVNKFVEIGHDALIAWDTFITDCDWHSIQGKNPNNPTIIGDHVWIGVGAKILKGANIGNDSIVTTNSVVVNGVYSNQVMLGGNPAKILKIDIPSWNRDMIN